MRTSIAFLFLVLLLAVPVYADVPASSHYSGHYRVELRFSGYDFVNKEVRADVHFYLNLPAGSKFVHVPLFFQWEDDNQLIVNPTSDYNAVLCGRLRPAEDVGLCGIALLLDTSSQLEIVFRGVSLPLRESTISVDSNGIHILLASTLSQLDRVAGLEMVELREIIFEVTDFQDSEPKSETLGGYGRRVIRFSAGARPSDIVVFAGRIKRQYIPYVMLGLMGILLGLFAAPRLVSSRSRAIFFGLLSTVGLIAITVTFFILLSEKQRFSDTTTIVTIGTVGGSFFGLLGSSVYFLWKE